LTDLPVEVVGVELLLEVIPGDVIFGLCMEVAPDGEDIVYVAFVVYDGGREDKEKGKFMDGEV
jgi:hypothetical protein